MKTEDIIKEMECIKDEMWHTTDDDLLINQLSNCIALLAQGLSTKSIFKWHKYPEVKPTDINKYYLLAMKLDEERYIYKIAQYTKDLYKFDKFDFYEYKDKRQDGFFAYDSEYGFLHCDSYGYWAEINAPKLEEEMQ